MKSQASRGLAGLNGASDASADQALIDDREGLDQRTELDLVLRSLGGRPSGSSRGTSRPFLLSSYI
jgi:hypothetical protein